MLLESYAIDVQYVNPFVESVFEVFSTMLGTEPVRGPLALSDATMSPRSLVALIGMSGHTRGVVALHLPTATAMAIVNKLLGTELRIVDDTVTDGIAELVNIIAGSAKAKFPDEGGAPINLGIPSVVKGNGRRIDYPSSSQWIEIPFECDLGAFSLTVTLE